MFCARRCATLALVSPALSSATANRLAVVGHQATLIRAPSSSPWVRLARGHSTMPGSSSGKGRMRRLAAGGAAAALLLAATGFAAHRGGLLQIAEAEEADERDEKRRGVAKTATTARSSSIICKGTAMSDTPKGHDHQNHPTSTHEEQANMGLPVIDAELTVAPRVPPPLTRRSPALLRVRMDSQVNRGPLDPPLTYDFWSFSGTVPGPFIRARVGDTLEVTLTNKDQTMLHNLDFHSVSGPGGGAPLLTVEPGETKQAWFKLLHPGLFVYHCAVDPIGMHIANGMYGLMLVEPPEGLPPVDKEFFVLQSEFYTEQSPGDPMLLQLAWDKAEMELPTYVVFNGRVGSLTEENMLEAQVGERIRIYFGNTGPNLVSSFHIIGAIMDNVYREGDIISPPAKGLQTTLVPAGGVTIVEFIPSVPGVYTMVDHSIMRTEKGAVGFINVIGFPRPDIYTSSHSPKTCPGCRIHP